MSALREIDLSSASNKEAALNQEFIRQLVAAQMWSWYRNHVDDAVFQLKIAFVSKTFRVKDLHAVFVKLFGPEV